MTYPLTSETDNTEQAASVERIKQRTQIRRLRSIQSLAARVQVAPDGSKVFLRFTRAQRLEHQVLIVSFGTLAITGLLQRYSHLSLIKFSIGIFGSVDTLRTLHHLAAVVMALQSVYHVERILVSWFIKRERGAMWPTLRDFRDLVQTVMFNAGLAKERPESDRFCVEEKIEYWAMLWGTPVMGITGVIMWFPIAVTLVLPGHVVPTAKAIHSWEALLATLAILLWHTYHTVIKEQNRSIFDGTMTEKEMQHAHPREYRRILAAHERMQKMHARNNLARSTALKENQS